MKSFCLTAILFAGALSIRAQDAAPSNPAAFSLDEARVLALRTHPRMTVAELRAQAAQEAVIEARAGFFPTISANATAVGTGEEVTRIAAGSLSNSQIYDHVGVGATASWIVTDFGRTGSLTEAARSRARAAEAGELATRSELLLQVDAAYYAALEARAVKDVAARTLAARQLLFDRTRTMAANQLKSELDVRFAQVGVDEARLLADQADRDLQAALAALAYLVGRQAVLDVERFREPPLPATLAPDYQSLVDLALRQRPEILRQRAERDSAHSQAAAARDARRPTVSVIGAAGVVPVGDEHFEHDFAAGGVNVNLPLFAGGLYRARQREAELLARDADAAVQDQEEALARSVRVAWLEAGHARERIALTASLLQNSEAALALARARFDQGLSSIVELNQAELAQTQAAIEHTTAEYDYRLRRDRLDFETGALR
ncbi:MAG TPA: TolC family protein [Candidatus Didemnitutus sp.]|nr:TolC family protein [Candidatus Didemnitutus sp.]